MAYSLLGKRLPRLDAREKTTGAARYAADLRLPGMLFAKVLRSPLPHARILEVDTSRAERLPGVKVVLTAKDLPRRRYGSLIKDESVFAWDKVRYIGDRVAAVAAVDWEVAEEALSLIRVEYEELPALCDPLEAMAPGAPLIHEELESYAAAWQAIKQGNVCAHVRLRKGDVARGFAEADLILEESFQTQMVHQGYIEPNALLATPDASGRVTVWVSTQSPFNFRSHLAEVLGTPLNRIRVVAAQVGGGFGGKGTLMDEAFCPLLALRAGRPVKAILSREEEFIAGRPRHPSHFGLKIGLKSDGTLMAGEARIVLDTGAYAAHGPMATSTATRLLFSAYRIPHLAVNSYCVYTNKVSTGACRAPGAPQAAFAIESAMDMIAERLGMDPLELRLKNAVADGDLSPTGQVLQDIGLRATLLEAQKRRDEGWARPGAHRGLGIATGWWQCGGGGAACQVRVNQDGTIAVATGSVDIGQGSTTVIAQIVAEELGVTLEDLTMVTADTDATPYDAISAGSRVTYAMGNAARRAALEVKRQLLQRAAEKLEANPEDLEAADRRICVKGSPERGISLAELAQASHRSGDGPILGSGSFIPKPPAFDAASFQGGVMGASIAPTYVTEVAEVEVDPETGRVGVRALSAAQDVGFAINLDGVEGQIEGGAAMGLGYALTEDYLFADGRVLNANLLDYKLPTAPDVPQIASRLVQVSASEGPFGAKGVGEPPIIPTAPAIANAIYDAVGVRIKELPITAEKVRAALKAKADKPALQ